jgi:hypothetical protein
MVNLKIPYDYALTFNMPCASSYASKEAQYIMTPIKSRG